MVAAFTKALVYPTITPSTAIMKSNVRTLKISGTHFGDDTSVMDVLLFPFNGTAWDTYQPAATVISLQSDSVTIAIAGLTDRNAGALTAWVIVNGVVAKAVVATVHPVNPAISMSCSSPGSQTCDADHDGVYAEACTTSNLCLPLPTHGATTSICSHLL